MLDIPHSSCCVFRRWTIGCNFDNNMVDHLDRSSRGIISMPGYEVIW